jgi:hypothetical protein
MIRLVYAALIAFIFTSPVWAEEKGRYFTNEDLEKYKTPASSYPPEEPGPANNAADSIDTDEDENIDRTGPKKHIIPYKVSEGTEMRIILPVTFNNSSEENMLLDTGAAGMHISYRLAERLGVFESDEVKLMWGVTGIGGAVPAIVTIIDSIKIGDVEYNFIPTTISVSEFQGFEGLIGMDFMANYSVRIDTQKHEVVFEELPERADMPAGRTETWWRVTFRQFKSMRASWESYRNKLYEEDQRTGILKDLKKFADHQYERADALCTRLDVYASMHAVPQQWR